MPINVGDGLIHSPIYLLWSIQIATLLSRRMSSNVPVVALRVEHKRSWTHRTLYWVHWLCDLFNEYTQFKFFLSICHRNSSKIRQIYFTLIRDKDLPTVEMSYTQLIAESSRAPLLWTIRWRRLTEQTRLHQTFTYSISCRVKIYNLEHSSMEIFIISSVSGKRPLCSRN